MSTSMSYNKYSQLHHTTTSIFTTTITNNTFSMCSLRVPALIPKRTSPTKPNLNNNLYTTTLYNTTNS